MRRVLYVCAVALGVLVPALLAAAMTAPPVAGAPSRAKLMAEFRRPHDIPFPANDPYTKAKADLGKLLFFDPILSTSHRWSCASCHNPSLSWGDGLPRAIGAANKPLPTRTPTLLNIAWIPLLGWDGKFHSLEQMVFAPITAPANMGGNEKELLAALKAIPGYRIAFAKAFSNGAITRLHVEQAIATYERTIVSGTAPFDRWIDGDKNAIGAAAKRGFDLFTGKAQCSQCHRGWNFTEGDFYDIGEAKADDLGRGALFKNSLKLQHAFKVPTLRDVARRGPYMHDGSVKTLADVIELYNRGGIDRPSRSELIKPLHLTARDKSDLIAFLKTLTAPATPYPVPSLPR